MKFALGFVASMLMCHAGSVAFCSPIDDAIKAIVGQEQSVDNLTASGSYKNVRFDSERKAWVPNGEWEVTSIQEGMPGGKYRMDCKGIIPWESGVAPFELRVFTATYDGRFGTVLTTKAGDFTKPVNILSARIEGRRALLSPMATRATGWSYSSFGVKEAVPGSGTVSQRLSDYLMECKAKGCSIEKVRREGSELLRVWIPQEKKQGPFSFAEVLWLDPEKGYSISRSEWVTFIQPEQAGAVVANSLVSSFWQVTEWMELKKGVFYPKKVHVESFSVAFDDQNLPKPPSSIEKAQIVVLQATINDPKIVNEAYGISLPKGTWIEDGSGNRLAIVQGTAEEQKTIIDAEVRKVEELLKIDGMPK